MRVENQPAFILHHYPYRDTSQILELLTRDFGRVAVVSRGSLSGSSRLKPLLQPFRMLLVSWSGRGDLHTLTGAEDAISAPGRLVADFLLSGFYLNELLMHFLQRHDAHDDVFSLYARTLSQLAACENLETVLRLFEKQLLEVLGFGLNLTHDADSEAPILSGQSYVFYVEHGPVLALSEQTMTNRPQVSGESLLAFSRHDLQSEFVKHEIKMLMRHVLAFYLHGKTLKSRELFRL